MDARILSFIIIGLGLMVAIGLDRVLERTRLPFPVPLVYVLIGYAAFALPLGLPALDPIGDETMSLATEYLTEFIVIASLLAAGIAIDRPFSLHGWGQVNRLILLAMPFTVAAIALLGWGWLGLAPASAILLGAALAPTDPVLAKSVAVGPPGDDERDDVRFDLTVESGLNDGLAFPFTYLAIAAVGTAGVGAWTVEWFALDFVWRIFAGVVVGVVAGRAIAWYIFDRVKDGDAMETETLEDAATDAPSHSFLGNTSEGLAVLGALLLAYGLAEAVEGYGFLSVFVGAVAAKQYDATHKYHQLSHHFIDQIEEIVLVAMMIGFGGLLASGILDALTWQGAALGILVLLLIRPGVAMLSSFGCKLPWAGRAAVAFFGVRGMGTIYYIAYAQNKASFEGLPEVWAVASFTILGSVVLHGLAAEPVMRRLARTGGNVIPGMPDSEFEDPGVPHEVAQKNRASGPSAKPAAAPVSGDI